MTNLRHWPGAERRRPSLGSPSYLHLRELANAIWTFAESLPTSSDLRLLDVGCSRKPYYPYFATRVRQYVGVDASITIGQPDCICVAERLPFAEGTFDITLSTQMIAYVDDPVAVLREMGRVLRPGGTLLLSTHGLFPNMRDVWHMTDTGLHRVAEMAGFEVVRIIPNGGAVMCLFQLLALYVGTVTNAMPGPVRRVLVPLIVALNIAGLALDRLAGGRAAHFASANFLVVARTAGRN
ncbi:MAG: class I SAM-dependent methyltransferase [Chloroflexota bacterium]|nr:MAG: class I SAM-dependent methyltransferase [Chloroflexota bacterium]